MNKDDYVQTNVILLCDKGVIPTPFIATPKKQNHHGMTAATIRDNIPLLNILPFGVCTVTRMPCIPLMPVWEDYPKSPYFIEGYQPLLLSSSAKCKQGGTIKIYTSYQEILALAGDKFKSLKEKLIPFIDKTIGTALMMPLSPILEAAGMGDVVQGVGEFGRGVVQGFGKGLISTFEGIYQMIRHPLDTLGGMAQLAGTAVVGYANPIPGVSPQQRLQAFDNYFGTNLADIDSGIKESLKETGDTLLHGSNVEKGEIVGHAIEFVAEIVVGTKGAGAAAKTAKAGSMGGKMAKISGVVDKVLDAVKVAGGKLKQKILGQLKKAIKGVFGKGAKETKTLIQKIEEAIKAQERAQAEYEALGKWNKTVAHDDIKTISGWSETPSGYTEVFPEKVKSYSETIGHDIKNAGALDQKRYGGFDGKYNSSHAEKKLLTEKPNEPIGVSRPMCKDCREFAGKQAVKIEEDVIVADPNGVHIFKKDGGHDFIFK